MKNYLLLLSLSLLLSSCSFKVSRNYHVRKPDHIVMDTMPLILKQKNLFGLEADYLGTIVLDDKYGLSQNCSERNAVELLCEEAYLLSANFVNITKEAQPDKYSDCYRCVASFYNIQLDDAIKETLYRKSRIIVYYSERTVLSWDDFRLSLDEKDGLPYEFVSNIKLNSDRASFWTSAYKDFHAEGVFYSDVAKVKPSFKTEKNLEHINGLYHLSQIYALKLESFLNSDSVKSGHGYEIQPVLEEYLYDLYEEQNRYKTETEYGQNRSAQERWDEKIRMELDAFVSKRID